VSVSQTAELVNIALNIFSVEIVVQLHLDFLIFAQSHQKVPNSAVHYMAFTKETQGG
jgi:hypothetical protein